MYFLQFCGKSPGKFQENTGKAPIFHSVISHYVVPYEAINDTKTSDLLVFSWWSPSALLKNG